MVSGKRDEVFRETEGGKKKDPWTQRKGWVHYNVSFKTFGPICITTA